MDEPAIEAKRVNEWMRADHVAKIRFVDDNDNTFELDKETDRLHMTDAAEKDIGIGYNTGLTADASGIHLSYDAPDGEKLIASEMYIDWQDIICMGFIPKI